MHVTWSVALIARRLLFYIVRLFFHAGVHCLSVCGASTVNCSTGLRLQPQEEGTHTYVFYGASVGNQGPLALCLRLLSRDHQRTVATGVQRFEPISVIDLSMLPSKLRHCTDSRSSIGCGVRWRSCAKRRWNRGQPIFFALGKKSTRRTLHVVQISTLLMCLALPFVVTSIVG